MLLLLVLLLQLCGILQEIVLLLVLVLVLLVLVLAS
jgi:hypothetical protein